jgi:16S rRNA (uracil1498-N3)-methyltransferase
LNLFYQPLIPEGIYYLDAVESRHCTKVLRKKNGDRIQITDGKGHLYHATISNGDAHQCTFNVQEKIAASPRDYHIHIAISPIKNTDRLEWFVEKAVELGVDEITLIECDHTEKAHVKSERLVKLAISAMKQSLKWTLPTIAGPVNVSGFITNSTAPSRFIAHVDPANPVHLIHIAPPHSRYLILIGPEGDFSAEELALALKNGFQAVSLGTSRLRTETAGLAACHILNLVNTR